MKGPFPSPEDEGTALFINKMKKLNRYIQSFFKKHNLQSGISLLEALVALTILAFVLLTAVLIRFNLFKIDSVRVEELTASAVLRQKCMDFQCGLLTNDFVETNFSEIAGTYNVQGSLRTNDIWLGLSRLDSSLVVADYKGVEKIAAYRSKVKYMALPRGNIIEPLDMPASQSVCKVHAWTTNGTKGYLRIGGTTNTNITVDSPYGSIVQVEAVNNAGSLTNVLWNGMVSATSTNVFVNDDREIEAVFP